MLTVGLCLVYVFPILFVSSLGDLEAVSKQDWAWWMEDFVNDMSPGLKGIVQGLIPVVLLATLMSLVPTILRKFAQKEGTATFSHIPYY